jgi:hypothetical protein
MTTYVVRVWVPDRPGALGAVASRIGAVRGDLVGIDILERGAGRAIDELIVELPDDGLVPLLVKEISAVDGVDVEDVRPAAEWLADPRLDALETAAVLVEQDGVRPLVEALARHAFRDFQADWVAVVDLSSPNSTVPGPITTAGPVPPTAWLTAFVEGSRASMSFSPSPASLSPAQERASFMGGPDDVAWAELEAADLVIVLGRKGRPLRARERRQLAALARIANYRWVELVTRTARLVHPSAAL